MAKNNPHSHLAVAWGNYILEARKKQKMLQSTLAKELETTGQFMGRIEKGFVMMPEPMILKCIKMFKIELKDLTQIWLKAATKEALDLSIKAKKKDLKLVAK